MKANKLLISFVVMQKITGYTELSTSKSIQATARITFNKMFASI